LNSDEQIREQKIKCEIDEECIEHCKRLLTTKISRTRRELTSPAVVTVYFRIVRDFIGFRSIIVKTWGETKEPPYFRARSGIFRKKGKGFD
jgi:hypothetical protein